MNESELFALWVYDDVRSLDPEGECTCEHFNYHCFVRRSRSLRDVGSILEERDFERLCVGVVNLGNFDTFSELAGGINLYFGLSCNNARCNAERGDHPQN